MPRFAAASRSEEKGTEQISPQDIQILHGSGDTGLRTSSLWTQKICLLLL